MARSALRMLKRIPGIDVFLKAQSGLINEPVLRLEYLSSAVKVTSRQFAPLHEALEDAVNILDLDDAPELFVQSSPVLNAMTIGMKRPIIVIHSALVDLMDESEFQWVLGHELGHAMSGHALYTTILLAGINAGVSAVAESLPIAGTGVALASEAIRLGFWDLHRKMEFSGDRAGLLVGRDPAAAIRALMKLAGGANLRRMSPEAFIEQALEYQARGGSDQLRRFLLTKELSHPVPVTRALEIKKWAEGGEYQAVIKGRYPLRAGYQRSVGGAVYAVAGTRSRQPLKGPLSEF